MRIADIFIGSTIMLALSQTVTGFALASKADKISMLETQIAVQLSNNKKCVHSLSLQNKAIGVLKIDLNASQYRWDNRTPSVTVVEKWRTKYIDRNITIKGDCENNTLILNAIHDNGF